MSQPRPTDGHAGLFPHPPGEQTTIADQPDPLDVPQQFSRATSYEVRDELEDLVRRDLLGPWDGELERFAPQAMGPRERYLVGMLGPKHSATSIRDEADQVSDTETAVQGGGEAELPDVTTSQNLGRIWASSMGLSCAVPADVDALHVTISWGRYGKQETTDDAGKTRTVWAREPASWAGEVRLDGDPTCLLSMDGADADAPGVRLAVDVRPRDGHRVVRLVLINAQQEQERNTDTAWLFQAGIEVTALDGNSAVFAPIDDPADVAGATEDDEETHLRLLYRHHRRYAAGHNIAVHPHVRSDCDTADGRRAWKLETTWLPSYDVPSTAAAGSGAELGMDTLATADPAGLAAALTPVGSPGTELEFAL